MGELPWPEMQNILLFRSSVELLTTGTPNKAHFSINNFSVIVNLHLWKKVMLPVNYCDDHISRLSVGVVWMSATIKPEMEVCVSWRRVSRPTTHPSLTSTSGGTSLGHLPVMWVERHARVGKMFIVHSNTHTHTGISRTAGIVSATPWQYGRLLLRCRQRHTLISHPPPRLLTTFWTHHHHITTIHYTPNTFMTRKTKAFCPKFCLKQGRFLNFTIPSGTSK